MKAKHYLYLIALGIFLLSSCKTYYIPVDSFRQQSTAWRTAGFRRVTTKGPIGDIARYDTYAVDSIRCVDKNGTPMLLANSPALEIRFTDANNKRTVFYFDLISVRDSTVSGAQSRIISSVTTTINLNAVKLIEIQDGGKRYRYVK